MTVTPSTSNFERCEITVAAASPGKQSAAWTVAVDFGGTFADAAALQQVMDGRYATRTIHGTTVIVGISGKTCVRAFQLPAGIDATAVVFSTGDAHHPCQPITMALDTVLDHVAHGSMSDRHPAGPALASTNLCAAEADPAARMVGTSAQQHGFGLHGCQWITSDKTLSVHIGAASWPPLGFDSSSRTFTAAGHQALLRRTVQDGRFLSVVAVDLGPAPVGIQGYHTVLQVMLAGPGDGSDRVSALTQFTAAVISG